MGPAFERQVRWSGGIEQRREHGLEHQCGAAGGADRKRVLTRRDATRPKLKLPAAELCALGLGPSDLRSRPHRRQVLVHEARTFSAGANLLDAKRQTAEDRKGQRAAQNLTPAFTERSVDVEHRDAQTKVQDRPNRDVAA